MINDFSKKSKHYVNNKELFTEFVKWNEKLKIAQETGKEEPQLTNKMGIAFMAMANRYASKRNWYSIQFKDEMISEAILACVKSAKNFNIERTQNPFAYFTMVIHNAFLQKIAKEKKQLEIKKSSVKNLMTEIELSNEFENPGKSTYLEGLNKYFDDWEKGNKKDNEN